MMGQKKKQKFFKISQRIFIAQRRIFFQNILQDIKFGGGEYFRGVKALTTLIFYAFFTFCYIKKRLKTPDDLKIQNFTMLRLPPNLDTIGY
jgi:hypothetical protein